MIVNIQAPSVAKLLWEMLKEIPLDKQEIYAPRVDEAASLLEHPNLSGQCYYAYTDTTGLIFKQLIIAPFGKQKGRKNLQILHLYHTPQLQQKTPRI